MKKIVRLTEGDINRLVNKVIKEDEEFRRPQRPRIRQERNPVDLGLFEKFFMGTRNANNPIFLSDYIDALQRELQSARSLQNRLSAGESNISGVAPPIYREPNYGGPLDEVEKGEYIKYSSDEVKRGDVKVDGKKVKVDDDGSVTILPEDEY